MCEFLVIRTTDTPHLSSSGEMLGDGEGEIEGIWGATELLTATEL